MVNYLEATLETIKDENQRLSAKDVLNLIENKDYLIKNFYYLKGGDKYNTDEDTINEVLDFLNIFAEHPKNDESFKHLIKFEFNNYDFNLGEVNKENNYLAGLEHIYTVFIYTSKAAKQHEKRIGNLFSHNGSTYYLAYNSSIFSKKDKQFTKRLEAIMDRIHEKEKSEKGSR